MDEQACPRCKTTKYRNPSLKLMVNVCGHTLCESCVDLLFLKGSGSCPECNVPLRRSNFRVQLFDDPMVEKEIDIRKRILRDFNKKEEDFNSLQGYNDYLEEIENIIYNLCNNIDIINTNKRIEQYKKENRDVIMRNKTKLGKEEYELEEMLEMEKQQQKLRQIELEEIEQDQSLSNMTNSKWNDQPRRPDQSLSNMTNSKWNDQPRRPENKKKKIREKEALIDALMSSYEDASKIVNAYAEQAEKIREEAKTLPAVKATQFSTGIKFSSADQQGFLPVPKIEEGPLYVHTAPKAWNEGPIVPTAPEIESKGSEYPVERAGGYRSVIACQRALQEAMQGLFHGS